VQRVSKCRTCGASIFWVATAAGKLMPVEAQPSPDGNVLVDDLGGGLVWRATVLGPGELELVKLAEPDRPRYLSHFATCAHAELHRRR
jgi:hypothetical protein